MSAQAPQHTIFISVGSNINREQHISAGLDAMYAAFGELTLSSVYESKSVGFDGNNFYNLVVQADTHLPINEVVEHLKKIETENLRTRESKKFAPRTLDLDLLTYDDVIIQTPMELPRPEILYNAFVLQPLAEIAPEVEHPLANKSYFSLWQQYDKSQQQLWPIKFTWSANRQ
ncbi:MAG: 2-amino-4-hydroxy-6-hydroxymethyldihydropteridine diphosphokinase [Alteromonadaceae bacterium]|jgi:2-amino-4-hydroxy-6-hydroxymethyldihydropteridine diphosphokinase|uniref:2-amino-4-hydroxy-6-hydroxymethyldihydropteridine diphosphokinase n=2 Tax=Paraglaciecola mesophila TaxID=197222 RepID=K6XRB1_9ALTE|nr:2-amino-4-hydroxy-6-hydroxymethyldihydropteridine diphosphokinase [Paraglaciecola mesophila]MAD16384.1 2-amino-4-hydroxy-6-hydroxymethyldihydropteridine diphosphokinase [Alteromonadaceae bacterium]MBB19026.1 2-amino-4-hydroxy-6-hydroxymethyldihydropteridine diphosphokinase [Rickettsiales bacterium]GAC23164.1 bifunctional folate synthesis protein [Paraglaciecola mesophila KMM 241]|tara:strand:- start:315 stop:833 length:519 start_codon:yes stop_codon:yes gene_type:complete